MDSRAGQGATHDAPDAGHGGNGGHVEAVDTVAQGRSHSLREAAERLGVAARTVRRYVHAGQLEAVQVVGRHGLEYRVPEEALASYLAQLDRVARVDGGKPRTGVVPLPLDTVATHDTLAMVAAQLDGERAATQAAWLRAEAAWERVAQLEAELASVRAQLPAPRRSVLDRLLGR